MHSQDRGGPLSEAECERLDRFLAERIPDDADTEGRNEGVLGLSELDGLLTAVVSAPLPIMPNAWLAEVWGDYEPEWTDPLEASALLELMVRHMNDIADTLRYTPTDYCPMFMVGVDAQGEFELIDEWCEGYARGVLLAREAWADADSEVLELLAGILAFTSATDWAGYRNADHPQGAGQARDAGYPELVVQCARGIHRHWVGGPGPGAEPADGPASPGHRPAAQPTRRQGPRVGRNAPCPCGSGKKYKYCCLQ